MKLRDPLETPNLNLRHLTADDVEKIYLMSLEEGMRQWIPDQVYEDEQESAEVIRFLNDQYENLAAPQAAPYVLGIELKSTGILIGHVGLSPSDEGIEIGYAIEDKYKGFGFATEAVSAMSKWALVELNLPAVLGIVDSENQSSCRVLEKVGYILVEEKQKQAFGRMGLCRTYRIEV